MTRLPRAVLFAATLVLATACGGPMPTPKAGGANAVAQTATGGHQDAKGIFESLCYTCHGTTGHGDGPGAAALQPKPRSFADKTWQEAVTDDGIKKAIVFGGAAVGKSPMMPAQPQLKGQTAVLDGLVGIVRGFKAK